MFNHPFAFALRGRFVQVATQGHHHALNHMLRGHDYRPDWFGSDCLQSVQAFVQAAVYSDEPARQAAHFIVSCYNQSWHPYRLQGQSFGEAQLEALVTYISTGDQSGVQAVLFEAVPYLMAAWLDIQSDVNYAYSDEHTTAFDAQLALMVQEQRKVAP